MYIHECFLKGALFMGCFLLSTLITGDDEPFPNNPKLGSSVVCCYQEGKCDGDVIEHSVILSAKLYFSSNMFKHRN